jgi:hypothetical protein
MTEAGCRVVFTDGHAVMAITEFFDSVEDLEQLDWATIHSTDWADTPEDNDRKRRKQAEFVVHHNVPWNLGQSVGVYDNRTRARVEELLVHVPHRPEVVVRTDWYYKGGTRR